MLQSVLGLDADRIGRAFLVPGATMGQRLVRAKAKIRDAAIPFKVPEPAQLSERVRDVLNAIYAAFSAGWEDLSPTADAIEDLAEEAIYLARLVVELLPREAEAFGLLSLMLHCEARRSPDGAFIPLSQQDPMMWRRDLIEAAEAALRDAAGIGAPGRYQTEAAMQSVHAGRLFNRDVSPAVIVNLHQVLVRQTHSIGAAVALAAAHLAANDFQAADQQLRSLEVDVIKDYQPYWVVRGRAHAAVNELVAAGQAFSRALELTEDKSVAAYLRAERAATLMQ